MFRVTLDPYFRKFMGTTILLIILIAVLLAVWPGSTAEPGGFCPSGFVSAIKALFIILLVLEKV